MRLYNKSKRSFILDSKKVVEGGRASLDGSNKNALFFDKDTFIEVSPEYGKKLLKMYPKDISSMDVQTDKPRASSRRKKA